MHCFIYVMHFIAFRLFQALLYWLIPCISLHFLYLKHLVRIMSEVSFGVTDAMSKP